MSFQHNYSPPWVGEGAHFGIATGGKNAGTRKYTIRKCIEQSKTVIDVRFQAGQTVGDVTLFHPQYSEWISVPCFNSSLPISTIAVPENHTIVETMRKVQSVEHNQRAIPEPDCSNAKYSVNVDRKQ